MTKRDVLKRVRAALRSVTGNTARGLLGSKTGYGKLYEAWVLANIAEKLSSEEGATSTLVRGAKLALKAKGGPINPAFPHIRVSHPSRGAAALWTNIYCLSLSYRQTRAGSPPRPCDYHELDIALVASGANALPLPEDIWFAVECKETLFPKNLLREVLGLRRELSFLVPEQLTGFGSWPDEKVPAHPPSCIAVYSTDPTVVQ